MKKHKNCMHMDENWEKHQRNSKILSGIFVIAAGVLILLKQSGMFIPHWLLSWEMILIAVGCVMLIKHNFKKTSAYVVIAIGGLFMLHDLLPDLIDRRMIWPIVIILIGFSILLKSLFPGFKKKQPTIEIADFSEVNSDDFVSSSAFFSGITKKVVTKNFKGASISSVFGGNEVNLSQADFTGTANIDITCVFGGVTLIVPSNWKIKPDLTSAFGGIDDQRPSMISELNSDEKVVILKGTCVFGGIEILSYN
jgi:predicted membrane protein